MAESKHTIHDTHTHAHGANCGHLRVQHDGHEDFLHDGHLHHVHNDHVDEHTIPINAKNPNDCTPLHKCDANGRAHVHSANCGHERVPHGEHVDYLVEGHLHHPHAGHCDNHGPLTMNR